MNEIFKKVGSNLRALGFSGSGQNWRKSSDDFIFIINFQRGRSGETFFINLGAQPVFIPAECDADFSTLKEYECVMRRRVGTEWPARMSERQIDSLTQEIASAQRDFFEHAQMLRTALATDSPNQLLQKFSFGKTAERAALHLARAAAKLGFSQTAKELVQRGLELSGERATTLRSELQSVLST